MSGSKDESAGSPNHGGPAAFSSASSLPAFQLSLPGFEGPIDLLVRLTERDELDITTVSLVDVTAQYLEHFRSQPWADAIALGDFVAMAARLLNLKSRSLLPHPPAEEAEEEPSEEDLLEALRQYRIYRTAASLIGDRMDAPDRLFPRIGVAPETIDPPLKKVPVEQLVLSLQEALARFPEPDPVLDLPMELVTVEQKLRDMRSELARRGVVSFRSVIAGCTSRMEVIVSFISILHLIRGGEIDADQNEPFGDITLRRRVSEQITTAESP